VKKSILYVRVSPENKNFLGTEADEMGVSLATYMNLIIARMRKGARDVGNSGTRRRSNSRRVI